MLSDVSLRDHESAVVKRNVFLVIDNIDSFVWNLIRYIRLAGGRVDVRRNDHLDLSVIEQTDYLGIVLSPGPGKPSETGGMPDLIRRFACRVPILGVCLGHQAIAEHYGARTVCADVPMHGKLSSIHHDGRGIFHGLPDPLQVTRYHSLVTERSSFPSKLMISAETGDRTVMGLRHPSGMLEGVQFHPEAELTEHGLAMITNFVRFCEDLRAGRE